jgi:hypothetical protein
VGAEVEAVEVLVAAPEADVTEPVVVAEALAVGAPDEVIERVVPLSVAGADDCSAGAGVATLAGTELTGAELPAGALVDGFAVPDAGAKAEFAVEGELVVEGGLFVTAVLVLLIEPEGVSGFSVLPSGVDEVAPL